jgi:hypothetical protein
MEIHCAYTKQGTRTSEEVARKLSMSRGSRGVIDETAEIAAQKKNDTRPNETPKLATAHGSVQTDGQEQKKSQKYGIGEGPSQ